MFLCNNHLKNSELLQTIFAGNFIRHGCSAFGEVEHMNNKTPNYIQHLFDCLESGTRFKFENGHVTFSNRYYKYTEIKGNFEVYHIFSFLQYIIHIIYLMKNVNVFF
jgi:predicted ATPase